MNDEQTFLAAIRAGDDVARLAYADWLEERGDPRAEWVRDRLLFRWSDGGATDPLPALLDGLSAQPDDDGLRLALRRLGPRVVPAMWQRVVAGNDYNKLRHLTDYLAELPAEAIRPYKPQLLAWLHSEHEQRQEFALIILRALGAEAVDAIPAAIALLPDPEVSFTDTLWAVMRLVASVGPPAASAVDTILAHVCCEEQNAFCDALVGLGPSVFPRLVEIIPTWGGRELTRVVRVAQRFPLADIERSGVLGHSDPVVRAPFVIGCLERDPALLADLPGLEPAFRQHPCLVSWLISPLEALGPLAAPAVPLLHRLREVAPAEVTALLRVLEPDRLREQARAGLEHTDPAVQVDAVETLDRLRCYEPPLLNRVEAFLDGDNDDLIDASLRYLKHQPVTDEARLSRRLARLARSPRTPWEPTLSGWVYPNAVPSLHPLLLELLERPNEPGWRIAFGWLYHGADIRPELLARSLVTSLDQSRFGCGWAQSILQERPQVAELLWPWLRGRLLAGPIGEVRSWVGLLVAMPDSVARTQVLLGIFQRGREAQVPLAELLDDSVAGLLHRAAFDEGTLDQGESLLDWLWDEGMRPRCFEVFLVTVARHTRSGPARLVALFDHADSFIATKAIASLQSASFLAPEPLAALGRLLRHPLARYRHQALIALGSRATWEQLLPLIEDPSEDVYLAVFEQLDSRGNDPRIWPHLITLADDESLRLRRAIVEQARHHLPPEQARAWLQSRLERETEPDVRDTICSELRFIWTTESEA